MKKIVIILTVIVIICTSTFAFADALSEYETELEKIKKEQAANAQKMTGVEREIAQDLYDLIDLDAKVSTYTGKLNTLNEKVTKITQEMESQEMSLQNASQSYNVAQEMYVTRVKIIYENGVPNIFDILFTSQGVSDFFSKINVLNSILEYDKSLVSNMQNQKEYVANIKKNIEVQKVQLEALQYDVEKSTEALKSAAEQKQNKLNKLQSEKTQLNQKSNLLKKQEAEARRKIDEELAKLAGSGSEFEGVFTGEYTWPTPSSYLITATFDEKEYRSITGSVHTGTDVGIGVGNAVVAMASGKVVIAQYNSGGYGYYIVIDHGTKDGYKYMTLYGHNSNLLVKKGDVVSRGQKIAISGNTGNSTGPHLHFEVNKSKSGSMWSIDPMLYFKGTGAPFKYKVNGRLIDYPFSNISQYQYSSQIKRSFSF